MKNHFGQVHEEGSSLNDALRLLVGMAFNDALKPFTPKTLRLIELRTSPKEPPPLRFPLLSNQVPFSYPDQKQTQKTKP